MRSQRRRNASKLCGASRKPADSRCYYDPPRREFLAIRQDHFETTGATFNATDLTPIQIRDSLLLVPCTIVNEAIQRNGLRYVIAPLTAVFVKGESALGVRNV
jgi:hypothetical protein